ncbi:biogenesis of lysosome-related organelles complex 1 subunit 3 [Pygocentrus nattereri]|uniref:Biogenesis of lysosome-related organelles complex 1 subunit 3 n=1 Tax=Pygocentrus nattereri TaxID=42514 RepID=A0A3B4DJ50_PYGNA|nr:biogenesis of lysosome-related organelles complex 1 subunit 3 [Pygocentrus nattereri]
MAGRKVAVVVQGEAEETDSDSDQEVYITTARPSSGLTVPGEASETDSEGEAEPWRPEHSQNPLLFRPDLPPLVVARGPEVLSEPGPDDGRCLRLEPAGQSTLLQQKLQESNARLCADVQHSLRLLYQGASRDIRTATAHLNTSQNGIINTSHSIRLILEDLRAVSEKIDIITSCKLLPDITAPGQLAASGP